MRSAGRERRRVDLTIKRRNRYRQGTVARGLDPVGLLPGNATQAEVNDLARRLLDASEAYRAERAARLKAQARVSRLRRLHGAVAAGRVPASEATYG